MDLYELKARYERQCLNGLMYLAKGDLALASNYLRMAMFKMRMKGVPCDSLRYTKLAKASEGFSGADVELACEKAKLSAIRSIIGGAPEETVVTKWDLLDAIAAVSDSKNAVNIIIVE